MNGLAIDSAITKITISAKNDAHTVTAMFNIGMKQSETLLPAIQYVLNKVDLSPEKLDYLAISNGPGSFTGLRLGFSAIKAIEMFSNAKLYGIPTLDVYAKPYRDFPSTVLSCIDAKKDRFYAKAFCGEKEIMPEGDYTPEEAAELLKSNGATENILICGSDARLLSEQLKNISDKKFLPQDFTINAGEILLSMAEKKISAGEPPLNDYDGPFYLRASEAEVKKNEA